MHNVVQFVEYYQKILVTYMGHSGNEGGLNGVSGGINVIIALK